MLRYHKSKTWKVKQIALAKVYSDWEELYDLLNKWLDWLIKKCPRFAYETKTTNFWYKGVVHTQF